MVSTVLRVFAVALCLNQVLSDQEFSNFRSPLAELRVPINLCKTSIGSIDSSLYNYYDKKEFHVTTCKRKLAIFVSTTLTGVEVYDSNDNIVNLTLNTLIPTSGQLLSIRVTTTDNLNRLPTIIVGDSFVDENGSICGSVFRRSGGPGNDVINIPATGSDDCMHAYFGGFNSILVAGAPISTYHAFSVDPDDLIPSSNTSSLSLITNDGCCQLTFSVPPNYAGGSVTIGHKYEKAIFLGDLSLLIASPDYIDDTPLCDSVYGGACDVEGAVIDASNSSRDINIQLQQPLGYGKLSINNKTLYYNKDGAFSVTVPSGSTFYYTADEMGRGTFLAKLYLLPLPTSTVSTVTTTTNPSSNVTATTVVSSNSTVTSITTTTSVPSNNSTTTTTSPGKQSSNSPSVILFSLISIVYLLKNN